MRTFTFENEMQILDNASNIRKKHCAMEWGVTVQNLIECEGLDYEEYDLEDDGFLKKITRPIKRIAEKIKAALIPREKTVLIDQSMHPAKKPFGQAHELGHHAIPEHREILYVCSENDLNPMTRRQMEYEANLFAAELLFPKYLLKNIYTEYPLSIITILLLAELAEASFHASAIEYVKWCKEICCLFILNTDRDFEGGQFLSLESQIYSIGWKKKYKNLSLPNTHTFKRSHPISLAILTEKIGKVCEFPLKGKSRNFTAHTFSNGYNGFALLF